MKKIISLIIAAVMCFSALCVASSAEGVISVKRASGNGYTYVTLSCDDAELYYTTDGSAPTTDSAQYTGRIKLTKPVKLRVAAYVNGELVCTAKTTVSVKAKKPTVTALADGTYTVKAPKGYTVYYTTDGSVPALNDVRCNGSVNVPAGTVLKFVAYKRGYKLSSVVTVKVPADSSRAVG